MTDVSTLDPSEVAPAVVAAVDSARDDLGHGRDIPLVGGQRPHVFEVTFNDGRTRVYADRACDALSEIIQGYRSIIDRLTEAEASGDRDGVEDATNDALQARIEHAHDLRVKLQARVNAAAHADGTWETLDEEEAEQCLRAANGEIPVGIIYEVPMEDLDGSTVTVDRGYWEHSTVKLVINRGDYGFLSEQFIYEPETFLSETGDDGREYVLGGKWPENMTILDPVEEHDYLDSLAHANVVSIVVREIDLPDQMYTDAVELGRKIVAEEES